jgi:hypothetical protein
MTTIHPCERERRNSPSKAFSSIHQGRHRTTTTRPQAAVYNGGQYATRIDDDNKSADTPLPNRTSSNIGCAFTGNSPNARRMAFKVFSLLVDAKQIILVVASLPKNSALAEFTGHPAIALTTRFLLLYTYVTNEKYLVVFSGGIVAARDERVVR